MKNRMQPKNPRRFNIKTGSLIFCLMFIDIDLKHFTCTIWTKKKINKTQTTFRIKQTSQFEWNISSRTRINSGRGTRRQKNVSARYSTTLRPIWARRGRDEYLQPIVFANLIRKLIACHRHYLQQCLRYRSAYLIYQRVFASSVVLWYLENKLHKYVNTLVK